MYIQKKWLCLLFACCLLLSSCHSGGTTANPEQPSATGTPETGEASGEIPSGTVHLFYDDRYSFSSDIRKMETVRVDSFQLSGREKDSAVLTSDPGNPRKVRATGIGTAKVELADGMEWNVQVTSAPLRLLFVFGQSNAEGMTKGVEAPAASAEARSQSVLCEEGQIYSTYAPGQWDYGSLIGGADFKESLSVTNALSFVASGLTSDVSLTGTPLAYPLNALSANGNGKSGMDSSIAYEWNRLTGEKVWIVNAAHSGSNILSWQPVRGEDNNFAQAAAVAKGCLSVLKSEISAGHFSFAGMGYFWLQGCADRSMTSARYTELYQNMHNGMEQELKQDLNGDGTDEKLGFGGIVLVRESSSRLTPLDLKLCGPRTSQMYMGSTTDEEYSNIYLASSVGDLFVTDRQVEEYYANIYQTGRVSYPTRTPYELPITVYEVHPDIHYRQPGYNELGADAVRTITAILNQKNSGETGVRVLKPDGYHAYADGEILTMHAGEHLDLGVVAEQDGHLIKGVRMESELMGVALNCNTVSVAANAAIGSGCLKVYVNDVLQLELQLRIV